MTKPYFHTPKKQKGASLLFTMVAILLLLLAAAISIKTTLTQQSNAGNLALRQELIQQSEWVIAKIIEEQDQLPKPSDTADISKNYSPHITDSNVQGIPLALLVSDEDFKTSYGSHSYSAPAGSNIKFRYFIERMCQLGEPDETSPQPPTTGCLTTNSIASSSDNSSLPPLPNVIYRISLRVDGPKNTQVFIQSTFTRELNT